MVKLEVPDKGRAWVIAFSACIINMILSGLSRMIGILYVAVIEAYGVSRQEATLPFTVRNSIRCLSGPIVGIVGQRYGIRAVTFCGGVVAATGAALCCIAPSVTWLAVFWGGIHGFGFAFANTLFQVVVNQYFQKYRATASGIALSGACVGSFAFPVMIESILDTYALSGGFLILGGIVMHVLPPSLLLRAPPWVENPERYARLWALKMSKESVETLESQAPSDDPEEEEEGDFTKIRSSSLSNCPVEALGVCSASRDIIKTEKPEGVISHLGKLVQKGAPYRTDKEVVCTLYKIAESPHTEKKHEGENGHASTSNLDNKINVYSISKEVSVQEKKKSPVGDSLPFPVKRTEKEEPKSIADSIKSIAVLYTSPVYVLISLCMATYVIIFIPVLTVIVDYGKDKGIPETYGKYLINAMAMGDLIGRLCFGWVTDKGIMSISTFMTLTLFLEGAFIALFPFANSLYSFMLLLALYGVTAGSILVLFPILVLKYVDQKAQSVAMGCVGFLSGVVSFAIPLLIGHFRDKVGSYDGMFYLTGVVSVVSGILWLLEPLMAKLHYRKKEKADRKLARLNNIEAIVSHGKSESS